jgi:CheY-like chemotaxis protein
MSHLSAPTHAGPPAADLPAAMLDALALELEAPEVGGNMMMPVMDGPVLITALRRIDPHVRIIAASGLNATANVARAAAAGVKDFLAKPYSADALLVMLKTVLTRKPPA